MKLSITFDEAMTVVRKALNVGAGDTFEVTNIPEISRKKEFFPKRRSTGITSSREYIEFGSMFNYEGSLRNHVTKAAAVEKMLDLYDIYGLGNTISRSDACRVISSPAFVNKFFNFVEDTGRLPAGLSIWVQ